MAVEVIELTCRICSNKYNWAGGNDSSICFECLQQMITLSASNSEWLDVLKEANERADSLMSRVFAAEDDFSGLSIVLRATTKLRRQMQELEAAVLAATIKAGKTPFAKAVSDELKRQKEQNAKRT